MVLLVPALAHGQLWNGILNAPGSGPCTGSIPSACAPGGDPWPSAGIPGGIPSGSWTQSGSTITSTGSDQTSAINTTLGSCGTNHFVSLASGTFVIAGTISIPSNCALRGQGANSTILNCTGTSGSGCVREGQTLNSFPSSSNDTAITSGLSAGSTSIVVASATNISVGKLLSISELNSITNGVNSTGSEGFCSFCDGNYGGFRARGQTVLVTGVSGTTITISPALFHTYGSTLPNWAATTAFFAGTNITNGGHIYAETASSSTGLPSPYNCTSGGSTPAFSTSGGSVNDGTCTWLDKGTGTTTSPLATPYTPAAIKAGIENLQIFITNAGTTSLVGPNLIINQCEYCWESGVEDNYTDASHVYVEWSFGGELTQNYWSNAILHEPGTYDSEVRLAEKTSMMLVDNNIEERTHAGVIFEWGASGNVVSYNYMLNGFDTTGGEPVIGGVDFHGAHPDFNLFEGNKTVQIYYDSVWGSSSNSTAFRNWMQGTNAVNNPISEGRHTVSPGGSAVVCSSIASGHSCYPFQALRAAQVSYLSNGNNFIGNVMGSTQQTTNLGYGGGVTTYNSGTGQTDAVQWPTTRIFDTTVYDYSFGYAEASDDGSWTFDSASSFTTALLHGNYGLVSNAIVWSGALTHTLPPSFYLSAKPSWWGSLNYPAIGPDVTTGTGTPGSHADLIPAENCFLNVMGGTPGSPGSPITFNASSCFSALPVVATPTASPVAGTYHGAQTATLSSTTGGATICLTLDGSTPTTDGNGNCTGTTITYTSPFLVDINLTVKAVGTLSGDTDSSVLTAAYVITHTTFYIRPDGGTKTQCTGTTNAAYPGSGSGIACAFSHPYWMMNNVPGWTSFIGGDIMRYFGPSGTSDTYYTGEQNAGVGIDWNANGLSVPCAPPNPGQANGASCVMPLIPSGTANAHTQIIGQNAGSCHDSGHTHLVNPTILSGIAGAFSIINLRGSSYVDISCIALTQPDTCTTVGNGTGKCGNLSNFVHFGGIVLNYLTGPGPSNITITDVAAAGIGSQGILGSNMSGTNVFNDVYVIGNGGAGLSGDGGGCGTSCESTGAWNLDHNIYAWNGCVAVNYDFTKSYQLNSYNFCMAQQEGSFANGDGFVQIAAGTGFVLNVNHSDFSNNVQDGFDALHLSDDLTTNPAINISNSIAAHNMGQTFKLGAGAASTAINNVSVGDCRALTVDSNYPLNPSGWSTGNQIVGDACRASGGAWVFALKAGSAITIQNNTSIGYATTTYNAGCISGTTCITGGTPAVGIFQNNVTYALADPGNSGQFASGWFLPNGNLFNNAGGAKTFNNWFQMRTGCPDGALSDTSFLCGNPGFVSVSVNANQTVVTVNPNITAASLVYHAGTTIAGITSDFNGTPRPPFSMGAFEPLSTAVTTHSTIGTKHTIGTVKMQ